MLSDTALGFLKDHSDQNYAVCKSGKSHWNHSGQRS